MKVIITGGEGFIGKALAAALIKRGVQVTSIDRKTGIEAGDFFNGTDLSDIDCVYHLAAQTSVFNKNQSDIVHDNIETFMSVCNACKRHNVKLVYASSSTAAPGNATSLYGITKRFNEDYAKCYLPSATGVRFHNVYGPNPRQGTLLWYLLNDDHVKLYNEGRNVRHFTYISDIVESLIYAYGCNKPLINAANPEATTTLQLAEIVSKYKPLEIELVESERELDRDAQAIETAVFTVPLQYTSVSEGINRIFNGSQE
ncbi:MAG: NAD(P)-dependent oxidoreductase [Candidatus Amulumruptor caecigallinarius]|nr:NAD(P)-dependent oxidoreductase [Candidatus Amulumruptor caecigallinarius]MCM1397451.1 NAD(P)-dependent oxidoreductase [Candidatus Amulumruptor caecigallinarius]MCM1454342.1 NAD(P)-dependent oxidoreductase [bacterium]